MRLLTIASVLALTFSGIAFAQEDVPANCDSPQSTQEINYCVVKDLEKADAKLTAAYKKAMASRVRLEKDLVENNPGVVGAAKALKAAQRAWIGFRTTNCISLSYAFAGGTGQGAAQVTCEIEMTIARTKELQTLADEGR